MFSIPINPKLTEEQFSQLYTFCEQHKDYIYDLYFTCRMPPFEQDAMGDVFASDVQQPILVALHMQNTLGIRVSATFNNIDVPPTQRNLDLWIKNFQQLYDAGIHSATIPHTHWVATGQIQKAFPLLQIKNTILRNAYRATEVAKFAEAGFHYVNLDRDIMRDRDELIKCRRVADKYGIKLALLANEGCLGACPVMDEHFQYNNQRSGLEPAYFHNPISRVSCSKWNVTDPSSSLKNANIPPWREDWIELLEYVDVFKMHGRESIEQQFSTMSIIANYVAGEEILYDDFSDYLNRNSLGGKPIQAWRKFIKNCKFDCWDCNKCDKLYEACSDEYYPLATAVANVIVDSVHYNTNIDIPGLTSPRVQKLLYGLAEYATKYVELGSAQGATAVSVASHPDIEVHCIDLWQDDIQPKHFGMTMPRNTQNSFMRNIAHCPNIYAHNADYFTIDTAQFEGADMIFFDGDKEADKVSTLVQKYLQIAAEETILVFDDANWHSVVQGANAGIEARGASIIFNRLILNEEEDPTQWWNGLYIVVVHK